jgi:hypothetical protein
VVDLIALTLPSAVAHEVHEAVVRRFHYRVRRAVEGRPEGAAIERLRDADRALAEALGVPPRIAANDRDLSLLRD